MNSSVKITIDTVYYEGHIALRHGLNKTFSQITAKYISETAKEIFDRLIKHSLKEKTEITFNKFYLYKPTYEFITHNEGFYLTIITPFNVATTMEISKKEKK